MKEDLKQSKGGGTYTYFIVEARVNRMIHSRPVTIQDGVLTEKWREVHFQQSLDPAGVPGLGSETPVFGLERGLPYESAKALAYTLIAQHPFQFIECRLVAFKIEYEWKRTRLGLADRDIASDIGMGMFRNYSPYESPELENLPETLKTSETEAKGL